MRTPQIKMTTRRREALHSSLPLPEKVGGSAPASQAIEKGTAMSFPSVELYGVELLQVSILALAVKCQRCKTINDVSGLKDNTEKPASCKKCASPFLLKFRQELVHQNSTRAGFIDVSGCTVSDLLPSTFVPTCGRCSTDSQGWCLYGVRQLPMSAANVITDSLSRFRRSTSRIRSRLLDPSAYERSPTTPGETRLASRRATAEPRCV